MGLVSHNIINYSNYNNLDVKFDKYWKILEAKDIELKYNTIDFEPFFLSFSSHIAVQSHNKKE
jgi:hypothetical protein